MTIRQFLSKMLRASDKQIDIKGSKTGVVGDHARVENLHIHENSSHLANQIDLETEIRGYCEKADTLYNNIPMVGFKTRVKVPIDLEQMYVPLRAVMDIRTVGRSCFGGAEEADAFFRECGEGRDVPLFQAFHLARQENRTGIVILGDPGSGKTTHLKRLLLWCLRGGLKELGLPRDIIPVFLPLRDLKDLSQGLDAFIQAQLNNRHLNTPEGFGRRMLERQNLLFLFDGLDEVSDAKQRAEVCRWIEDARSIFKNCFFVVTCRFAGYRERAV